MIAKKLAPTWFCDSIYDINPDVLLKNNIKTIFFDLDNTLIPYYEELPYESTKKFVNYLKDKGLNIYVISNNDEDRVSIFSNDLGCKYSVMSFKPLTFKLRKFIKKENLNKKEIIIIGDQLLTDIICSKLLKIKSCLAKPACEGDLKKTKLNRFFDNIIRNKQIKKGYLNKFERSDYNE
jgi:HAD superfamily phosphatase (TIGR01668 family)